MRRQIKCAALLGGGGLLLQLVAALHWTPLTFVLSAAIAVPLVLAGSAVFLHAVWRNLSDKDAI
jgi:hypothetical protein